MKKLTLFFLTFTFLLGCQPTETEKTITIGDRYSLTIPSFLKEVHNLNEDASLQYQNAWKEFYVLTIDESKEEFQKAIDENQMNELYPIDLNGYANILIDVIQNSITVFQKSDLEDEMINGLHAKTIQITGKTEGIEVYFSFAFIKGQNTYYQIMTWTTLSKKMQYNEKMDKLIHSFKEL